MSQRFKESETRNKIKIQFCDKSVVISRSKEQSIAMSLDEAVEVGFNSDNASAAKSDVVAVDVVVLLLLLLLQSNTTISTITTISNKSGL